MNINQFITVFFCGVTVGAITLLSILNRSLEYFNIIFLVVAFLLMVAVFVLGNPQKNQAQKDSIPKTDPQGIENPYAQGEAARDAYKKALQAHEQGAKDHHRVMKARTMWGPMGDEQGG